MSRHIHDKVNHQLIPVSGYGSRMATSIEDKTLTIHGSYANVEGYNYGKADITDAVELIAPIETELVASRAYSVGKQFVYRGFLYKVTAPIALDAPIVIGTNCELAPDVSEQINELDTGFTTLETQKTDYVSYTLTNYSWLQVVTYLMNNAPTGRTITGVVEGTSGGTASFIGYVYPGRTYGSVLLFTVASSGAVQFGLRRASSDSIKTISGS